MASKLKTKIKTLIQPRLRIVCGEAIALGPGKAELLAWVAETGSIREAARKMDMSYMRAWMLIHTMNDCFKQPLVIPERGGTSHGGTTLTEVGRKALGLYQQLEADCLIATKPRWAELRKLLRKSLPRS